MSKYLIAVGGTGMRCLESFVHLCAIGMLDNEEINVLMIDTDHDNGNKSQTNTLIEAYQKIKADSSGSNGATLEDSFFSAVINFYKFIPTYKTPTNTFDRIKMQSKSTNSKANQEQEELADLFFEKDTQDFDLEHGYRAQTHLGSYLMYYEMIDEVKKIKTGTAVGGVQQNGLTQFIQKLGGDTDAKVFILGSIFGGTGASSIPIIPRAFREASKVLGVKLNDIMFGSTLLSEYFTFNSPNQSQLDKQKIVANANGFRLNSQAALMYYDSNDTVKKDYQQFYMLGWPDLPQDYTISDGKGGVVTGGDNQLNPAHILELISAFAAYDFFKSTAIHNDTIHEWQFKSVEEDINTNKLKFDFSDLIGTAEADRFKLKLTAFFSMSLMLNNEYKKIDSKKAFLSFYNTINNNHINGAITIEESEAIDTYIKHFAFYYDHGGKKVVPGWLFHVRKSTQSTSFLFEETAFSNNYKDLLGVEWANILSGHHFAFPNQMEKLLGTRVSFDRLKSKMVGNNQVNFLGISKANEKLLKWIYDTYSKALN
jgi:hypothetical protein